ncbi:MAG TPA: polyhydroxyalkanoic acid system family protein [Allosphingosinicella sp.]
MSQPHVVDIPHKLGQQEARRRIENGVGRIADHVPGGAKAEHSWEGDKLRLRVEAMGQAVSARIEVLDAVVRVELMLPAALSFFAKPIEAMLKKKGTELLEDRR